MQKIRSILKIGASGASLCDNYGSTSGISLEMMLGTGVLLEFELHSDAAGESAVLPDYPMEELNAQVCYCAFDFNCANSDSPALLLTAGVEFLLEDSGRRVLRVPVPNTASESFIEALKNQSHAEVFCEIGGCDAAGNTVFAWQFKTLIRSRVYLGNGSGSAVSAPEYYTALQIDAIVSGLSERIDGISAGAEDIYISEQSSYFAGVSVENALQEIGSALDGVQTMLKGV